MDFLKKYVVPGEWDASIYKISANPLIILQLNVNPVKQQKHKKRSKRDKGVK